MSKKAVAYAALLVTVAIVAYLLGGLQTRLQNRPEPSARVTTEKAALMKNGVKYEVVLRRFEPTTDVDGNPTLRPVRP